MRGKRYLVWLASLTIATLIILADTGQSFVGNTMRGHEMPPFYRMLLWPGIWWYSWAILGVGIYYLSRKYPLTREHRRTSIWIHLAGCLVVYVGHVSVQVAAMILPVYHSLHATWANAIEHHAVSSIFLNMLMYWCVVAASHAFIFYARYRERELHTAQLQTDLHKAQLESLKMQLQPHFLFNTLNAISTLMYRDVSAADQMIARLGDLLRRTIDQSSINEVSLAEEIDFIKKYLDIEQARFGNRLSVTFDVSVEAEQASIPSLILQPLVENAIKHGISRIPSDGRLLIRASVQNNRLQLSVSDNGPGINGSTRMDTGTGISNTRRRLDTLYGDQYTMSFTPRAPAGLIATIEIPYTVTPSSQDVEEMAMT